MPYKYNMKEALSVAQQASNEIENYLRKLKGTVDVLNVEDNELYQTKDIDLIWKIRDKNNKLLDVTIEVKGDRWEHTGNYFFETISNKSKGTPGCFMYTEADYIYYYFVNIKELHRIPVLKTRKWFIKNLNRFPIKETSTPVGNGAYYITVGRTVPKHIVQKAIPEIRVRRLYEVDSR